MFPAKRATLAVAALFHFAFSQAAAADDPDIDPALIEQIDAWIDTATDLPAAAGPVRIAFADAAEVAVPGELASAIGRRPRGLYDPATQTITLVRPWSAGDPQDLSVLVHELIHQRQGSKHYYCEAAKEHAAYHAQKVWLAERGLPLEVNWIAVVLASSCIPRDIHGD